MPLFKCFDCQTEILGTSCAYVLSRQMEWKNIPGCYSHCRCGYPVRAKELRDNKFDFIDSDKNTDIPAFIYCENPRGQGHVYYGTYDTCDVGNGYTAKQMENNNAGIIRFGRYSMVGRRDGYEYDQEGDDYDDLQLSP